MECGRKTHKNRKRSKPNIFLLPTVFGHQNLSHGTLISLPSEGSSFKTCYLSVDLRKALELFSQESRFFLKIWIDRENIKVPQDYAPKPLVSKKVKVLENVHLCMSHMTKLQGRPFNIHISKSRNLFPTYLSPFPHLHPPQPPPPRDWPAPRRTGPCPLDSRTPQGSAVAADRSSTQHTHRPETGTITTEVSRQLDS